MFENRDAWRIENDRLRVTILEGAGHLAEIVLKSDGGESLNPWWIPPWPSIDPWTYDAARHGDAYLEAGWTVYPVNPNEKTIEGLEAYPSLADVPAELDRISVYLPPRVTLSIIPEIAEKNAGQTLFNPGSANPRVYAAADQAGFAYRPACSIVDIGLSPAQFP